MAVLFLLVVGVGVVSFGLMLCCVVAGDSWQCPRCLSEGVVV